MKTLVKCLTVVSSMIGLAVTAVFPTSILIFRSNAETLTEVTLTPEQTLALFGYSLDCTYKTNTGTAQCTFTYEMTYYNNKWVYVDGSAGAPAYFKDYVNDTQFIFYTCPKSSISGSVSSTGAYIHAPFSVDIQGIRLFHAPVLAGCDQNSPGSPSSSYPQNVTLFSTFDAEPIICPFFKTASSQYLYGKMGQIKIPYDGGVRDIIADELYNYADCIANSQSTETDFDVTGLDINFFFYPILRDTIESPQAEYYVLAIGCPTLTEGYNAPAITTAPIDYSPVLSDINSGVSDINVNLSGVNSRLDAILQKLDAIYARMAQNMPNPSLIPAQTIPLDLQQYYSGIASQAPSASAVNGAVDGIGAVPFSDIVSRSGLGSLFGLLVALCAAGWVLTRGRGG